jgi:hypothetical protein
MNSVSLLPPEYKQQQKQQTKTRLLFIVMVGLAAIAVAAFALTFFVRLNYSGDIKKFEEQNEVLNAQIAGLRSEELKLIEFKTTAALLSNLTTTSLHMSDFMMELVSNMPTQAALSSAAISYGEANTILCELNVKARNLSALYEAQNKLTGTEGIISSSWENFSVNEENFLPYSFDIDLIFPRPTGLPAVPEVVETEGGEAG